MLKRRNSPLLGCGFRLPWPLFDVQRLVLPGRGVATLAALCFAAQWALLRRALARGMPRHGPRDTSMAVVGTVSRLRLP